MYDRVLLFLLRFRWATLLVVTAALGTLGWGFWTRVQRVSFSDWFGQRTTLNVSLRFPRGSDPQSLDRGMREFEQAAVGVPGVEQVITRGGSDGAYMTVVFEKEAGLSTLPYELQDVLTQRAILIGGASVGVYGQGPGFSSGGVGVGSVTFRIKLLGYSFSGLERMALDLKERLERIPRVRDVDVNAGSFWRREKSFAVTLLPDRASLARHGLTVRDFAQAVTREVSGPVGAERIELDGDELRLTLKAQGARDRAFTDLQQALLPVESGAPVRVQDVARVEERETLSNISREDQQYVRIVSYDFRGPQKLANRTHEAFMRSISVPAGYSASDQVFAWEYDDSAKGLWLVFAIGVALVLLSVALVFDSAWAALVVLLSLPLAFAGVAGAFWAAGANFSREAAVGVILVVGLSVNQAILFVDGVLQRRRETFARDAFHVVRAATDRAGMIVLVTLTTLASLLPLAIGTEFDSLFGAIALATTGGTVAATLGTLFVLPAMVVRRVRSKK